MQDLTIKFNSTLTFLKFQLKLKKANITHDPDSINETITLSESDFESLV